MLIYGTPLATPLTEIHVLPTFKCIGLDCFPWLDVKMDVSCRVSHICRDESGKDFGVGEMKREKEERANEQRQARKEKAICMRMSHHF